MGSETSYTVYCPYHPDVNVYEGYSKATRDRYVNTYNPCWKCVKEKNARAREQAAARARREEERRVRELMARLEREERARQEKAARELEARREKEREEWRRAREKLEKERRKIDKTILKESDKKIKEETDKRKRRKKPKKPYNAWKNSDVSKNIQDIGNQAAQCSAAGQVIAERVDVIKKDLQKELGKDYELIEEEVTRYEGYADEMKGMTNEFINAFGDIFKTEGDQQEFNKDDFDEDAKEFDDPDNDEDDKKHHQDEMRGNIQALSAAIDKMKIKLKLMEQYYINMQQDYDTFLDFIQDRQSEFGKMQTDIDCHLSAIADELRKQKDRDVFQGQTGAEYEQKVEVEATYDIIQSHKEEREVEIGNHAKEGALIGGIAGGVIAGMAGGTAGVVGSVAIAGALLGALIGSLFPKYGTETEWKTEKIKNGGKINVEIDKQVYDGEDHAEALEKIRDAMIPKIKEYLEDLKSKSESAVKKKEEFMMMELQVQNMIGKADGFKGNIDHLLGLLSDKPMSESQKKQLDKKWQETKGKVDEFVKSIDTMKKINEESK